MRCSFCDSPTHEISQCPALGKGGSAIVAVPETPFEVQANAEAEVPQTSSDPPLPLPDLFNIITGHEIEKSLIARSLAAEKPISICLVGPPASSKTLFLTDLARLPGSFYVVGSGATKAGLMRLIADTRPRLLLLDEIDKLSRKDQTSLLSAMDTGILSEAKAGRTIQGHIQMRVFAAANQEDRIIPELKSRFILCRLKPYTDPQLVEVMARTLALREKAPVDLAYDVANACIRGGLRDVRSAVHVRWLLRPGETPDDVVRKVHVAAKGGGIQ